MLRQWLYRSAAYIFVKLFCFSNKLTCTVCFEFLNILFVQLYRVVMQVMGYSSSSPPPDLLCLDQLTGQPLLLSVSYRCGISVGVRYAAETCIDLAVSDTGADVGATGCLPNRNPRRIVLGTLRSTSGCHLVPDTSPSPQDL